MLLVHSVPQVVNAQLETAVDIFTTWLQAAPLLLLNIPLPQPKHLAMEQLA